MNRKVTLSIFLGTCILSASSAPRPNLVLIDIAHETLEMAKHDTVLTEKLTPVVGNVSSADVNKLPKSALEKIRNCLSAQQRRNLIAKNLSQFVSLEADNQNGTEYYANKLAELSKTTDNADKEAAHFQQEHAGFCKIFADNANTNAIKLGLSLKSAYESIDSKNPTKGAVKDVLKKLEGMNKLKIMALLSRRIKLNNA